MRLKTFTAPSMTEAMEEVRRVMGGDAIIISTHEARRGGGVQVTAARDESPAEPTMSEDRPAEVAPMGPDQYDNLEQALAFHGLPAGLRERLLRLAKSMDADDDQVALSAALDAGFDFSPLIVRPGRAIMLIGQPGAGKTVTLAKLATQAVLAGTPCRVISTDTIRAGGIGQLSGFTDILGTTLHPAESPDVLRSLITDSRDDEIVLIDSPGTNPFNQSEIRDLKRFLSVGEVEPVLVAAAGGDALEAAELAAAFRQLGPRRLLFTRLDATRRYGSIVAAADAAAMVLGDVSLSPYVAEELKQLNPVSMARLLLRQETIEVLGSNKEEQAAQ